MRRLWQSFFISRLLVGVQYLLLALGSLAEIVAHADDWPRFRGINGSGIARNADPPVEIGTTASQAWNIEFPSGNSSPCVADGRVFLTSFDRGTLETHCVDLATGTRLWKRSVIPATVERYHRSEGSPASSTPAVHSSFVVSYFGSCGVYCYTIDGREVWQHPLPVAQSSGEYGTGSSPLISGELILINRDQRRESQLIAIDLKTGDLAWRAPRPLAYGSFGTPVVWSNRGVEEVVVPGSLALDSYARDTGLLRWSVRGLTTYACTSPVVGDGNLFFGGWAPGEQDEPWPDWASFLTRHDSDGNGSVSFDEFRPEESDYYRGLDIDADQRISRVDWELLSANMARGENKLIQVTPGGTGDITESHVAWQSFNGLPYVASPLYSDGRLYLVRDGGILTCVNASDGRTIYSRRIGAPGRYYASPVSANGRLYLASVKGVVTVVKEGGAEPAILSQATFPERILATPAIVGRYLILRTESRLMAFESATSSSD